MNTTGKAARKRHGTRYAAKRARARKAKRSFGKLRYSSIGGTAQGFVSDNSRGATGAAAGE